jgi:DNA/RNA-binding domain of Phe-tRNA-synthetase-like protein
VLRTNAAQKEKTNQRTVYEALVYDVLNRSVFDSIADLSDAVKEACAKHRIPYSCDDVAKAIRSVGSRRRLL